MKRVGGELAVTKIEEELFAHVKPLGPREPAFVSMPKPRLTESDREWFPEVSLPPRVREAVEFSARDWRFTAMWPGWMP